MTLGYLPLGQGSLMVMQIRLVNLLIDWSLMPTLAVFQLYRGVVSNLMYIHTSN